MTTENNQAGIFRLDRKDLPALQAAAVALGQAFYKVDLSNARNVPGFIKALKRDLQFPDWFGNNLDALNDCSTIFPGARPPWIRHRPEW